MVVQSLEEELIFSGIRVRMVRQTPARALHAVSRAFMLVARRVVATRSLDAWTTSGRVSRRPVLTHLMQLSTGPLECLTPRTAAK